jgi:hypothetical protein
MAQRRITDLSTFSNYGMSRLRTGFTTIEGSASIDANEVVTGGMMMALALDMKKEWGMFNGSPDVGNELIDTLSTPISKQFFEEIAISSASSTGNYAGSPNYSQASPSSPSQHVMLFKTTNDSLPNNGTVSRGLDQNYRIRFEFDLRHRLYHNFATGAGDREFADELYQLNLRMDSMGYYHYNAGNQINEQLYKPNSYYPDGVYLPNPVVLPASGFPNTSGWEDQIGIPNPMYGWFKVNVGCSNQLLATGDISSPQTESNGIITLENGSTIDTAILRMPGECIDLTYEDVTILSDPADTGPYYVQGKLVGGDPSQKFYYPLFLDQYAANQFDGAIANTATALNITGVTSTNPVVVTTSAAHSYTTGQPVAFSGISPAINPLNGNTYYVKLIVGSTDTFQVYMNSNCTIPLDGSTWAVALQYTTGGTVSSGVGTSIAQTFTEFPLLTVYVPTTITEAANSANWGTSTAPTSSSGYKKYINNRSLRFRNKKKGAGWFKRFPKTEPALQGAYPFSYRLTMTERGLFLYMHDDAASDQADDYSWIALQRTVNNETGLARTDEASKFPVHVMYSCSRDSMYSRDAGVYFSQDAANLQNAETTVDTVYDEQGNTYNLSNLDNSKTFYILSPYDREDYLADEYTAKNIWRFVAREFDILKPTDVHKFATRHQIDSNAVINPLEQLSITDENRFVITFPTGLTTQRFMYPKEEMDLICFSSAEVVAESSNIPMTTYKYDGTSIDKRRYQGMRSTAAFGNGMRIMALVNGQNILNSDVILDVNDPIGLVV